MYNKNKKAKMVRVTFSELWKFSQKFAAIQGVLIQETMAGSL